jgi:hypothetical protein
MYPDGSSVAFRSWSRQSDAMNAGQPRGRARDIASLALVVLASVAALAGGLCLYLRQEIVDSSAFADRAVSALRKPAINRVVAREIAVQVVEPSVPDIVAARPVIVSAVKLAVGSDAFRPVIRLAAENGHKLLFERGGGNAVFDVADAGTVVSSALRTLAPNVARKIPRQSEAILLTLRRRSFAADTLRFADTVRVLGIVLPILAFGLFVAGVVIARDRRRAITAIGIAVGVTGVVAAIALALIKRYVVTHVYGTEELTNQDVRAAVSDLWSAYLGDLMTWILASAAVGWLLAAASSSVLSPYSARAGLARLRTWVRGTSSVRARAVRGALALAGGIAVIVEPGLALRVVAVVAGCVLVYFGAGEVLSVAAPTQPRMRRQRPPRRYRWAAAGAACAAAAAGLAFAVVLTGGARNVRAGTIMTCNGYAQLCDRRLDEVVFAGTHNSMSAADSPGWLISNQDRAIDEQLRAGIRLFKISAHYATEDSAGGVHTDIAAEGNELNRVAAKLAPAAREALQRLSRSLSSGSLAGRKREIFLCHTLCELGATRMLSFLVAIKRFLQRNPDQVVILFDEDYVPEPDLQRVFQRAGLFQQLATLRPKQPLPTLGELIRTGHNVVVFAQKPTSGRFAWNANAFAWWIQDTPLGAKKPGQFTCKDYRGSPSNPLLMMNDWADIFPPRPGPNVPLVQRSFILARARQCIAQRGRIPNLILTDYYNRGDLVGAVAALNGVAGRKPAPLS